MTIPTASEKMERCGIFDSDAAAKERMDVADKRNKRKAKRLGSLKVGDQRTVS